MQARHPKLGTRRNHYSRQLEKRLNALGVPVLSRANLAVIGALFLTLLCLVHRLSSAQEPAAHRQLHDQPDYTKIRTGKRSARLCNPAGRCSTWHPGRYDWSTLTQQGLYRDFGTADINPSCTLAATIEKDNRQEQVITLSRHTDCHVHCRNLVAMELSCSLDTLMAQWMTTNNEQIVVHSVDQDNDLSSDVTLVSQFSVNRLSTFRNVIQRWNGPISIAIYLTEQGDADVLKSFLSLPENLLLYSRMTITIVQPNYEDPERLRYPVNHLRNLALVASRTSHVFVIDADFVPSKNLYEHLTTSFRTTLETRPRTALVVPCFALRESHSTVPETMDELRTLLRQDIAYITDPRAGHGPTLAKELAAGHAWSQALTFEVCYESQWEPYYVVLRASPLYDVRFKNQGGDKQSHALQLNAEGYQFLVTRDAFIIHKDHPKMVWPGGGFEKSQRESGQAWNYFGAYMQELQDMYGKDIRWPRGCSASAIGWQEQRRDTLGLAVGAA